MIFAFFRIPELEKKAVDMLKYILRSFSMILLLAEIQKENLKRLRIFLEN